MWAKETFVPFKKKKGRKEGRKEGEKEGRKKERKKRKKMYPQTAKIQAFSFGDLIWTNFIPFKKSPALT